MSAYASTLGTLHVGAASGDALPEFLSDTYTEVPETGQITPPQKVLQNATYSVTNDGNKRSIAGNKADKVVSGNLVIDWDEDIHQQIHDDADTIGGVLRNWYIQYPTGRKEYFKGRVTSWIESPIEGADNVTEHRADYIISVTGDTFIVNV